MAIVVCVVSLSSFRLVMFILFEHLSVMRTDDYDDDVYTTMPILEHFQDKLINAFGFENFFGKSNFRRLINALNRFPLDSTSVRDKGASMFNSIDCTF